jgi:hypothetical protein
LENSQRPRVEEVEDEDDAPFSHLLPLSPFILLEEVIPPPNIHESAMKDIPSHTPNSEDLGVDVEGNLHEASTSTPASSSDHSISTPTSSSDVAQEDLSNGVLIPASSLKPALNRRSRRRLAQEIEACNYRVISSSEASESKPLIELRKHMT